MRGLLSSLGSPDRSHGDPRIPYALPSMAAPHTAIDSRILTSPLPLPLPFRPPLAHAAWPWSQRRSKAPPTESCATTPTGAAATRCGGSSARCTTSCWNAACPSRSCRRSATGTAVTTDTSRGLRWTHRRGRQTALGRPEKQLRLWGVTCMTLRCSEGRENVWMGTAPAGDPGRAWAEQWLTRPMCRLPLRQRASRGSGTLSLSVSGRTCRRKQTSSRQMSYFRPYPSLPSPMTFPAALLSLRNCRHLRAERTAGDGPIWAARAAERTAGPGPKAAVASAWQHMHGETSSKFYLDLEHAIATRSIAIKFWARAPACHDHGHSTVMVHAHGHTGMHERLLVYSIPVSAGVWPLLIKTLITDASRAAVVAAAPPVRGGAPRALCPSSARTAREVGCALAGRARGFQPPAPPRRR